MSSLNGVISAFVEVLFVMKLNKKKYIYFIVTECSPLNYVGTRFI
jgi:hypothetical protein